MRITTVKKLKNWISTPLMTLCAFFLFTAQQCENKKPEQEQSFDAYTMIKMNKTACFGTCPIFRFEIDGTGKAQYDGDRFVDKLGPHEKLFAPGTFEPIMTAFIEADYWSFEDKYVSDLTDLPTTFLTFQHNGKEKKIQMYHGVPKKLRALEAMVDSLANSEGWKAVSKE